MICHLGDVHQEAATWQEYDIVESPSATLPVEHDSECEEVGGAITEVRETFEYNYSAVSYVGLQLLLKLDAFVE